MKISFYTCFSPLFGRFCHSWKDELSSLGHEVRVFELPRDWSKPLPVSEDGEINLFAGGISMLWILEAHGFPGIGKNIIWMFEPLVETNILAKIGKKILRRLKPLVGIRGENVHDGKTETMSTIGHKFDAIIGMNFLTTGYVERHFPEVHTIQIPYTIDPKDIISPFREDEKQLDILQLGVKSSRREKSEKQFRRKGVEARFIYGDLYDEDRHKVISQSKISLHIHASKPFYFSQHRIFEAWAAGSVVVSEPFCDKLNGAEEGTHLIVTELEQFPEVCEKLLADREQRKNIVTASQELLMSSFIPGKWSDKLLELCSSVI